MAKVTITLRDTDDGETVTITVASKPGFPGPASKDPAFTPAQSLGLEFIKFTSEKLGGNARHDAEVGDMHSASDGKLDTGEDAPCPIQLARASDDGMPEREHGGEG